MSNIRVNGSVLNDLVTVVETGPVEDDGSLRSIMAATSTQPIQLRDIPPNAGSLHN